MCKDNQKQIAFDRIGRAVEQQFNIKIASDGRWFHEGGEIHRKTLVKLFSTVLKRESDGVFWLETPVEKGRIEVEDAPFIATALTVECADEAQLDRDATLYFTTNVDDHIPLDMTHPLQMLPSPDGSGMRPYIEVRDGLLAKLSRPVYYELAARAVTGDDGKIGVWSHDHFFVLE
jgi:hypothetical protein